MANYYVNLPAPQVGRNAMLDLSPVNNALNGVRQQNNENRNALLQQQQMDMRKEEQTYQRGRDQKQDMQQSVKRLGDMASAYDRLTDPAQRQAGLERILAQHPNAGALGPEYRDPAQAFKLIAAEAGQWRDPREDQMTDLDLQLKRAQITAANQRADQSKVVEVNGKLVRVTPKGQASEIYDGGPSASKLPSAVQSDGIKADQAYNNLVPALENYKALIKNTGAVALPGRDKDAVVQARRNIQLQLKELYNLGVLNGPDLELMDRMVFDPSINVLNPFDYLNAYDTVGRGEQSIDQLQEILRNIRNNKTKVLGMPDVPAAPNLKNNASNDLKSKYGLE